MLCEEKVETPATYFARQGRGIWKSREDIPRPYSWNGFAVGQILSKPEYMGHTVNFRTHKESYKDKRTIVHAPEKIDGDRTQQVDIYLKFIGRFALPAPELTLEEEKRQASLHRHRVMSRERYQKINAGEYAVGQPFKLICKCCGEEFESTRSNTLFCDPNCRAKFYRQEAAENRKRECVCGNCGKAFTTTRGDVKYCCEACQRKAHSKMRYRQK